jgi:hypothetical protein
MAGWSSGATLPAGLEAVLAVHLAAVPPLLLGLRGKQARTNGVAGLGAAFFYWSTRMTVRRSNLGSSIQLRLLV